MGLWDLFIGVLSFVIFVAVTFGVTVPVQGIIVRFRANYTPKGVGLHLGDPEDPEDVQPVLSQDPRVGPVVNSLWAMYQRVQRLEGIPGLYKGIMPTIVFTSLFMVLAAVSMDASFTSHRGKYYIPSGGFLGSVIYATGAGILAIPTTIITNRAITTPHKLDFFALKKSIRVLFTPYERKKPWALWLTPGLMAATVVHILWIAIVSRIFRALLIPALADGIDNIDPNQPLDVSLVGLVFFVIFSSASTVVLCPLEVISTRLSLQRNHFADLAGAPAQAGEEEEVEYAATEDVIGLRSEEDPYVGLVDCAKRIIDEEGIMTLYRAWWLTMFTTVFASFA
ncbi:hypothetical protein BOTBODRAFT_25598 [Botryobasidium botryosum FD-172 SS1]|uniref:Mitochondrial carrier n=1 Tax=Botryobasidium botryosum (strain FD-172 SS1) TaxID=930990 RepID=A0A067N2I2_BOTB1|nr:hypothetical protein BOTBODRAFT_25598 [Botryobasidium botryosum FD-172 SS1]